jgi:uncharacterized protein
MSYRRVIEKPSKSFFLLGPRGTGKSTWLKTLNFDLTIDLLNTRERLTYLQDPSVLLARTSKLKQGDWVLIDEVQKVPELLDEVHSIYESKRINFALSGSSARKLKRVGVNLLAGRAINRRMFPLIQSEYGRNTFEIDALIDWGTLPLIIDNWDHRQETLSAYVDNYLRQELIEEGIIRKIEPFARFLSAAGQLNGQILNVENVAREAKVKRPTVDKYFEILYDTLIGFKLPAYQPNVRVNESAHSKFYFFDSGVARAAAGYTYEDLDQFYRGFLFETFLLNEVRAYNEYANKHRDLFYYAVRGGGDIDLVVQVAKKTKLAPDKVIAIEFKLGSSWRSDWAKSLDLLNKDPKQTVVSRSILVYTGMRQERHGRVELLPVREFLDQLHVGQIF